MPIRVDIRSDKGSTSALLTLESWTSLTPVAVSAQEFQSARASLAGFNEVTASVTAASVGSLSSAELAARVRRLLNVFPLPAEVDGEGLFAGSMRKPSGMAEDRVLVGLRLQG